MNLAMRRIAAASFVGALLEWYDFYAFATASALVFGPLFFPSGDPLLSIMASFGAFASGFLARPIGGLIFGDIGDRIGRKASLIATLVIIGTGTFLIGLLPTFQQAGIWAPILLVILRVLQGIGLGGEYAGASLITIEHAPSGRRGFWGSLPQAASPGGLLLSSLVFELIALLPPGAFIAWGWRVPFLLSAIMLGSGSTCGCISPRRRSSRQSGTCAPSCPSSTCCARTARPPCSRRGRDWRRPCQAT